jgi:hypothetical protein
MQNPIKSNSELDMDRSNTLIETQITDQNNKTSTLLEPNKNSTRSNIQKSALSNRLIYSKINRGTQKIFNLLWFLRKSCII